MKRNLFRSRRDDLNATFDDLADWPAEIGAAAAHGKMPRNAVSPGTLGIGDRVLWDQHGITGGIAALFAKVDAGLSADTRAWRRHRKTSTGASDRVALDGSKQATAPVDPNADVPAAAADDAGGRNSDQQVDDD